MHKKDLCKACGHIIFNRQNGAIYCKHCVDLLYKLRNKQKHYILMDYCKLHKEYMEKY